MNLVQELATFKMAVQEKIKEALAAEGHDTVVGVTDIKFDGEPMIMLQFIPFLVLPVNDDKVDPYSGGDDLLGTVARSVGFSYGRAVEQRYKTAGQGQFSIVSARIYAPLDAVRDAVVAMRREEESAQQEKM